MWVGVCEYDRKYSVKHARGRRSTFLRCREGICDGGDGRLRATDGRPPAAVAGATGENGREEKATHCPWVRHPQCGQQRARSVVVKVVSWDGVEGECGRVRASLGISAGAASDRLAPAAAQATRRQRQDF